MVTERRRSGPKPKPLSERFWPKVDKTGDCWLWTGHRVYNGYGLVTIPDGTPRGNVIRAHRFAYEEAFGPIPDGMFVLHNCDNPPCVRPEHLRVGTALDNMRDRLERGRHPQTLKTHCPQGHPYSGENLIVRKSGRRSCRACAKVFQHNKRQRSKQRAAGEEDGKGKV